MLLVVGCFRSLFAFIYNRAILSSEVGDEQSKPPAGTITPEKQYILTTNTLLTYNRKPTTQTLLTTTTTSLLDHEFVIECQEASTSMESRYGDAEW